MCPFSDSRIRSLRHCGGGSDLANCGCGRSRPGLPVVAGLKKSSLRLNRNRRGSLCANFLASSFDLLANLIANQPNLIKPGGFAPFNLCWIAKTPVQSGGASGEDWTLLGASFIAHRDDISE